METVQLKIPIDINYIRYLYKIPIRIMDTYSFDSIHKKSVNIEIESLLGPSYNTIL